MQSKTEKEKPGVSLIIPNYNGREILEKNLPSIYQAAANPDNRISEIIIIDDASKDFSVKYLKSYYPDIKVVKHRIRRGTAACLNTGVRTARNPSILILRNCCTVNPDLLVNSLIHFQKDEVFAVTLHQKGRGWSKAKFSNGFLQIESGGESSDLRQSFSLEGGNSLVVREKWLKLGGLDEKTYVNYYWENLDISYRALKRGWEIIWDPTSLITVKEDSPAADLRDESRRSDQNELLFIWKNISSVNLFAKHLKGLSRRIRKQPSLLYGFILALTKLPKIIPLRNKEKKESKVSDESVFAKF